MRFEDNLAQRTECATSAGFGGIIASRVDSFPSADVLRELEGRDPAAASLWHELRADALSHPDEAEQCRFALAAAAKHATGIRRATLLRRLADAQLLAGQPDAAMVTLQPIGRVLQSQPMFESAETSRALAAAKPRCAEDDWSTLSSAAALAAVELTRAEALSHLIRRDEAMAAFADVERRLQRIEEPAVAQLWIRWARAQTWFLCEILGDAAGALDVCARVRTKVSRTLSNAAAAIALLRAEEIASTSAGDFERGKRLVEEQILLAQQQGAPREECLAWNARAILHYGEGELDAAKAAYGKALKLALATRWSRREAITTHNLATLALEQLELDEAWRLEQHYQALSLQIGNTAGQAEAPLLLAAVELARGSLLAAEPLITHARRAAEQGGWVMLIAQARALQGRLHLQRYIAEREPLELGKARTHLMAAADTLEEHSVAWSEELDPGETYALLGYALHRSGQLDKAREVIQRGEGRVPKQNTASTRALGLGRAAVEGQSMTAGLTWFDERGYKRIVALWRGLAG